MRKWLILLPAVVALAMALGACASAERTGEERTRSDPNRLTAEELTSVRVSSLYDAVERLRPRWLRSRGGRTLGSDSRVYVYQGQTRLGDIQALRQLAPDYPAWLEYLDGPTASATLPGLAGVHVEGAIVIHTAR